MSAEKTTQHGVLSQLSESVDAVERGQSFRMSRDGHRVGPLGPLRPSERFVSRDEFAATSQTAPEVNLDAFRKDQDAALEERR